MEDYTNVTISIIQFSQFNYYFINVPTCRAVIYHNISIQQNCLRQWMAAVQSRSKSARLLYQHRLLRKGLSAFKFAVMSSKVQAVQLETRLKITTFAKYFNKVRIQMRF